MIERMTAPSPIQSLEEPIQKGKFKCLSLARFRES